MVTMRRRRAASAMVAVVALLGALLGARRPSARPAPICDPPSVSQPEPALDAPTRPDWLLAEHRYIALARWLAAASARPGTPASTLDYVRGVLANKENENAESIRDLEPLVPRLDPVADSARFRVVLKTLADDYLKTYRYGDAANALDRLYRASGATMAPADRTDLRSELLLRRALRNAPRQRTVVASPFAIPLTPNAIGLRDVTVHVGRDSSKWIFDTGANLSTITETVARRLRLHVITSGSTTSGITGVAVPSRVAVIPEMRIGAARVENAVVLVMPDSMLDIPQIKFQITAILGYPVLEALGRLAIGTDSLRVDPAAGEAPSDSSNLFLDDLSPVVSATVGDSTRLFHFDSGADATMLSVRFCRAYSTLLSGLDPTHTHIGGAGGDKTYEGYELARLPLAIGGQEAVLDSVFVMREEAKTPFDAYYGNLSGTIAARYGGYTIDFRAMTFRLGAGPR